ncbi:hypothetical protein BOX15_Mlig018352g2 [Macrostomum lignano]|uniref:Uncharacterized protein n=1 Tax=Macrostomum lignano TaxID=282301 RepID=A0A267EUY1_9PLAT|nr:hypothetical protein BOX15_Mlig018352g2 [Macrostomum lignano]
MCAAVASHAVGSYPYPQAILSQVTQPLPVGSPAPGRPCRNATHMRSADGQAAVYTLDGPLRSRVPLEAGFPSVRLRLRPLHATTASTWTARRDDQLAAYFSEAAGRYRVHPGAGRWASRIGEIATANGAPASSFFPDDPAVPRRRPLTVGVGNRKNLCSSSRGVVFAACTNAEPVDASVATETRDCYRRREAAGSDSYTEEERQSRLEVQRHRERMRESAQVADLLAPAGAAGGDSRSRFWSESARANASLGESSPMRRCSTAPAETSFRRVSGNRVLSRLRDQCAHMPVIS